eukprot:755676-Hanusia_phi.AAC.3
MRAENNKVAITGGLTPQESLLVFGNMGSEDLFKDDKLPAQVSLQASSPGLCLSCKYRRSLSNTRAISAITRCRKSSTTRHPTFLPKYPGPTFNFILDTVPELSDRTRSESDRWHCKPDDPIGSAAPCRAGPGIVGTVNRWRRAGRRGPHSDSPVTRAGSGGSGTRPAGTRDRESPARREAPSRSRRVTATVTRTVRPGNSLAGSVSRNSE